MERIISRDFVVNFIPDIFRQTVDQWYDRYFDCRQNTGRSAAEDEVSDNGIDSSANGVRKRPCTDECLDETRLDKWFRDDPNPNDERIVDYVRWLNDDASDVSDRDNRATFDDVATWFADRRRRRIDGSRPATVSGRTSRLSSDSKKSKHIGELAVDCGDNVRSASEMVKENGNDGGLSPLPRRRSPPPIVRRVPVLPNRNAVYVLDAIYPKPETRGDDEVDDKNIIDDDDEREMEIVCDSDVDDTTEKKVDAINGKEKTGERKVNGKEDTIQEEATDLRVHKKACRSDSGASVGSGGDDDRSPRNSPSGSGRSTTTARRSDDDHYTANGSSAGNRTAATGDYFSGGGNTNGSSGSSSSVNGDSPTYPSALHLMPNRLLFPAGPPPPPPPSSHPLTSLYQHHQRALQLAAMSRAAALGLHLSGHPFAPTSPVATAAAAASGRPPSHAGGTVVDDFRNFGSAGSGNGFDGSANGSFSALRTGKNYAL